MLLIWRMQCAFLSEPIVCGVRADCCAGLPCEYISLCVRVKGAVLCVCEGCSAGGVQQQSVLGLIGWCVQVNNLAVLLKDQGKVDEAEPLYRESLAAKKETLGDKHPDTLRSVSALVVLVL